jgi:hypothetical protein
MTWTSELDNKLKTLMSLGYRYNEAALKLNVTTSAVRNRCYRLGVKNIYVTEKLCFWCGSGFTSYIKSNRKYCSNSCANSCSNSNRTHSEETKAKIRETMLNKAGNQESKAETCETILSEDGNQSTKTKARGTILSEDGNQSTNTNIRKTASNKVATKVRKCRTCRVNDIHEPRKLICEDCRMQYYEFYRPSCEFDFDVNDFQDEFDLTIVNELGWYSPSNRGNNLRGVSRDHVYSVKDGFINKVDYRLIKHPANCNLMVHSDNSSKHDGSGISLEALYERIAKWDVKYKT